MIFIWYNELERIRKESFVAHFKVSYLGRICHCYVSIMCLCRANVVSYLTLYQLRHIKSEVKII